MEQLPAGELDQGPSCIQQKENGKGKEKEAKKDAQEKKADTQPDVLQQEQDQNNTAVAKKRRFTRKRQKETTM